jgi:putative two-component system response regulator
MVRKACARAAAQKPELCPRRGSEAHRVSGHSAMDQGADMTTDGSATTDDGSKKARVLIVDDEQALSGLLERLLKSKGYVVAIAADGPAALQAVVHDPPDVILLDVVLPGMDGFTICRRLKNDPVTRLTPVILITGLADRESRIKGLAAGADDFLTKPVDGQELLARVGSLARLKRYTDDLDSAASIIMALAVMIEARAGYSEGHCHRVANYATALGRRLGLGPDALQALYRGGFMHDIGMLAIPDSLLRRRGPLEPEEFELVKSHTVIGDGLCSQLRSLHAVRAIIRHHHERFDGSGYPDGLRGEQIPIVAQIISLVDVYDAITTERPYQLTQSIDEAFVTLRQQVEKGWREPELVEHFAAIVLSGRLETFTPAPLVAEG